MEENFTETLFCLFILTKLAAILNINLQVIYQPLKPMQYFIFRVKMNHL